MSTSSRRRFPVLCKNRFLLHHLLSTILAFATPDEDVDTVVASPDPATAALHPFEGIGALSAGASSRLLIDYVEPQRSEILDFLFLPQYGAALQILKLEIGSGAQSTDGSEPSVQPDSGEDPPECSRGYELWLAQEALKRNKVGWSRVHKSLSGATSPDAHSAFAQMNLEVRGPTGYTCTTHAEDGWEPLFGIEIRNWLWL